jgi:hypothetical protein
VSLELQRVGDATEDAAVGEEVLAEALPRRREGGTTVSWRATFSAHAVSSSR